PPVRHDQRGGLWRGHRVRQTGRHPRQSCGAGSLSGGPDRVMANAPNMLEVRDLHAYYGKSHILRGVNLDVREGEIVSLLGRNGVGRSTTCKAIMGLVEPQGSVRCRGRELAGRRTLMGDPDLILIDEPTEGLAPRLVEQVGVLLEEIAKRGISILLVEQKLTIALKISGRLFVMGHGQIVFQGTPAELNDHTSVRQEWLEV